ncbi:DNA mismatch repair protein MutL [Acetobacter orientalis]|uniref:DNA mismatch repair protein MutL n=1 Tax=Acetobacter orientalis TaxID=146474 RepID=A0A2Z5ZFS7_9PROT|nr:DNA mismatch repair protein MutL [Acetobacter orientalis]
MSDPSFLPAHSPILAPAVQGRPTLRRLPEVLVNRIAAGEVIERPAAALKELVENAIDSGAKRLDVSLGRGGIDRIIVTDDGCGMTPDELVLAVERHCTSKLQDESLVHIRTLGFRGRPCLLSGRQHGSQSPPAWRVRPGRGVFMLRGARFLPQSHALVQWVPVWW